MYCWNVREHGYVPGFKVECLFLLALCFLFLDGQKDLPVAGSHLDSLPPTCFALPSPDSCSARPLWTFQAPVNPDAERLFVEMSVCGLGITCAHMYTCFPVVLISLSLSLSLSLSILSVCVGVLQNISLTLSSENSHSKDGVVTIRGCCMFLHAARRRVDESRTRIRGHAADDVGPLVCVPHDFENVWGCGQIGLLLLCVHKVGIAAKVCETESSVLYSLHDLSL